jgi:hypothetical protein
VTCAKRPGSGALLRKSVVPRRKKKEERSIPGKPKPNFSQRNLLTVGKVGVKIEMEAKETR